MAWPLQISWLRLCNKHYVYECWLVWNVYSPFNTWITLLSLHSIWIIWKLFDANVLYSNKKLITTAHNAHHENIAKLNHSALNLDFIQLIRPKAIIQIVTFSEAAVLSITIVCSIGVNSPGLSIQMIIGYFKENIEYTLMWWHQDTLTVYWYQKVERDSWLYTGAVWL